MEFKFNLSSILKVDQVGFAILTKENLNYGKSLQQINSIFQQNSSQYQLNTPQQQLKYLINTMGELSRKAQGLGQIVTSYEKLSANDDILFLKVFQNKVQGILRIGKKNLFYSDRIGKMINIQPMCLLDFYVHESCQRSGIGKELFEKMLDYVQIGPQKLAYDKPSSKLLPFLKKHYQLNSYMPQNNNFVIFNAYFDKNFEQTWQKNKIEQDKTKAKANLNSNKSEVSIQNQQLDPKQVSQNNSYQQQKYMSNGHQSNNSLNQNNFQQPYYNIGINNSQYNSNTNPKQQFYNGNNQYNSQPNSKQQNYHYSDKNSHTYIDEQLKYDYTPEAKQLRQKSIQEQEEELIKLQKEIEHLNFNKQQDIASSSQYKQYRQPNHGIFGHYNYGKTFQTSSNSYGQGSGYRF